MATCVCWTCNTRSTIPGHICLDGHFIPTARAPENAVDTARAALEVAAEKEGELRMLLAAEESKCCGVETDLSRARRALEVATKALEEIERDFGPHDFDACGKSVGEPCFICACGIASSALATLRSMAGEKGGAR